MSINMVAISGNLSRDPEMRVTPGGTQVLSFSVAVNERRKNPQTGSWEDYPNWVDCTMFGAHAEAVSRYLSKGSKVAIEGKLRYSSWDRDGQRRSKLEVIVDEIELMKRADGPHANRPAQAPQAYQPGYQAASAPQVYAVPAPVQQAVDQAFRQADVYDGEIPFGNQ